MRYFLDLGTHKFEGLSEFTAKLNLGINDSIFCFEPNKTIFNISRENIENIEKKYHSFKHYNLAIMDYTGKINFNEHNGAWKDGSKDTYINGYTTGSNCLDINPKYDTGNGVYFDISSSLCNCIDINEVINSIIEEDNNAEIYIKCDIEGSEFVVLPRLLVSKYIKNIKQIYIEWHERFWYGTNEYYNKIFLKNQIIENFKKRNIQTFIHH